MLNGVFAAKSWKERERRLSKIYIEAAKMHNRLKITKRLPAGISKFHGRPYLTINAGNFAGEIRKKIKSREVEKIKFNIGSVDQFSDSTDFVANFKPRFVLKKLYN